MSWLKLSETLPHERRPDVCQKCGADRDLSLWVECDDHDRPTPVLVTLCKACEVIIEPHPRLYSRVFENKPIPGAMGHLCGGCRYREGFGCTHPDLKANGGQGLMISVAEPIRGFISTRGKGGRRGGGYFERWQPARDCKGRAPRDGNP